VYASQVYSEIIVGLVAWLVAELAVGNINGIVGVIDCTGALRAVFTVFIV